MSTKRWFSRWSIHIGKDKFLPFWHQRYSFHYSDLHSKYTGQYDFGFWSSTEKAFFKLFLVFFIRFSPLYVQQSVAKYIKERPWWHIANVIFFHTVLITYSLFLHTFLNGNYTKLNALIAFMAAYVKTLQFTRTRQRSSHTIEDYNTFIPIVSFQQDGFLYTACWTPNHRKVTRQLMASKHQYNYLAL